MADIKSAQADRFAANPDDAFSVFLIYGPDAGLIAERGDKIAAGLDVDLKDPFAYQRFDADQIASDPSRLVDEAGAIAMFGGNRLLRISGTTRRNLADCVAPLLASPPQACWVVIEAGDLKRDSALRRSVEKSKSAVAIPCYSDGVRELDGLIRDEMEKAGLAIDREAAGFLKAMLGGDRMASRNELAKLALYCDGKGQVTIDDVQAIIGDTSQLAMDDLIDAVMTGDLRRLEQQLARLEAASSPPDMILMAGLRQFQTLRAARHAMDHGKQTAVQVMSAIRPPLHFSRREAFVQALARWPLPALQRAIERLDCAVLECRANAALASSLAGTALLALAAQASRAGRGR